MREPGLDPIALARAQQPRIDEDATQPIADRAMDQRRGHRGIYAAGESHQDPIVRADARANLGGLGLDHVRHRPVAGLAANPEHEVAQDLRAARRVDHLRMELDSAQQAVTAAERRVW